MRIYQTSRCPYCGRQESTERIARSAFERAVFPKAKRMKCRLCLSSFLASTKTERNGYDTHGDTGQNVSHISPRSDRTAF